MVGSGACETLAPVQANPDLTLEEEEEMIMCMDSEDTPLGPLKELYVSPCFKVSAAKHEAVHQDLADVKRRLKWSPSWRKNAASDDAPPFHGAGDIAV